MLPGDTLVGVTQHLPQFRLVFGGDGFGVERIKNRVGDHHVVGGITGLEPRDGPQRRVGMPERPVRPVNQLVVFFLDFHIFNPIRHAQHPDFRLDANGGPVSQDDFQ